MNNDIPTTPIREFQEDFTSFLTQHNLSTHDSKRVLDAQAAFNAGALSAMSILMQILTSKDSLLSHKASEFVNFVTSQPR